MLNKFGSLISGIFLWILLISLTTSLSAYSVSELTAVYRNGQVFITWKCPNVKNLKYKVYRSTTKFTSTSQINSSNYLGYVRDSSSKNIRKSRLLKKKVFFKIESAGSPLTADRGLYVVTCTGNQSWYYAVTVTNLLTNKEVKTILLGKNSLTSPVAENIAEPQPVWQDSALWTLGDVAQGYVQFVNNQELPHYPAMANTGSYGFNFNVIKRGQAANGPLYVFFEGLNNTAINGGGIEPFDNTTNCYIISLDDWLPDPLPNYGEQAGLNTYWCCYHENFDIYSSQNPVPASGIVRTYPQKRFKETIEWAHKKLPVDTTQTFLIGMSAGGFGALLTANMIPEKIAAVYVVVSPIRLKALEGSFQQLWGSNDNDLPTDVTNPLTGETVLIWDLLDIKKMLKMNMYRSFPLIFSIHGKKDLSVGWIDKPAFYDSADATLHGGVYYWDRREHDRDNADFLDSETMPDFSLYKTNKSYPALSNCSINQNPGNGNSNNGDPYGAINGYFSWEDGITDEKCDYEVTINLKDFYVGGVLDQDQYYTCTADVTFRRLQEFKPLAGATITWKNFDSNNDLIQSGSVIYNGDLITLTGIQINKSGSRITLDIANCTKENDPGEAFNTNEPEVNVIKSFDGYELTVEMNHDENVVINIYDMLGRIIEQRSVFLSQGTNTIKIAQKQAGLYISEFRGNNWTVSQKLLF